MPDTINHHFPHRLETLNALPVSEFCIYEVPVPSILGLSFNVRAHSWYLDVIDSRVLGTDPRSLTRFEASQGILVISCLLFIFSSRS